MEYRAKRYLYRAAILESENAGLNPEGKLDDLFYYYDDLLVDYVTPEGTIQGYTLKYLDMVDHDGDGFNDLRLLSAWGARGGQETYVIWCFDQETETFQFYGVESHGEMVDVW